MLALFGFDLTVVFWIFYFVLLKGEVNRPLSEEDKKRLIEEQSRANNYINIK